MSVYFVYRSHYEGPSEKHVQRFEDDDTVLGWFQRRWNDLAHADQREAYRRADEILGTAVCGIASLGVAIAEHDLAPPGTVAALGELLDQHLDVDGEILLDEHSLQVITTDVDLRMAYFLFDDWFLQDSGGHADFLLHDDWRLPASPEHPARKDFTPAVEAALLPPEGKGDGRLWINVLAYYSSGNLQDLEGARVIPGIRLTDLSTWLLQTEPTRDWSWPLELRLLRSQLLLPPKGADTTEKAFLCSLAAQPDRPDTWAVYSDWLLGRGEARAELVVLRRALERCTELAVAHIGGGDWKDRCCGDLDAAREDAEKLAEEFGGRYPRGRELSLINADEHLAQACLFTAQFRNGMFHQWIFFDDLWAAAHPTLANGVLRFASRWDVLSPDGDSG